MGCSRNVTPCSRRRPRIPALPTPSERASSVLGTPRSYSTTIQATVSEVRRSSRLCRRFRSGSGVGRAPARVTRSRTMPRSCVDLAYRGSISTDRSTLKPCPRDRWAGLRRFLANVASRRPRERAGPPDASLPVPARRCVGQIGVEGQVVDVEEIALVPTPLCQVILPCSKNDARIPHQAFSSVVGEPSQPASAPSARYRLRIRP